MHPGIRHYHESIQTLTFGEHCTKLKNMVAAHRITGVSARATSAESAPAEMVKQLHDFRTYADELEAENEELRDRLQHWENRLTDGERRQELERQVTV